VKLQRRTLALIGMLHTVAAGDAWAQCAMCRQALASPEGQQLVASLRAGVLILLAAPFVLFGIVATLAIRLQRPKEEGNDEPPTGPAT
jgi:hypothetical protein